jgi:formiminotetrahydrofolate cyclodeaminase
VAGLARHPLERFLEEVAAARPAPGGGSSAGVACALAAALTEMAAGLARPAAGDAAARAASLRARGLELAQQELGTYEQVLEALRLPEGDPQRAARVSEALEKASGPPLEIAEAAAETAELAMALAARSSPSVRGDALTGAILAEAAAAAAASLVEINLGDRPGHALLRRAHMARERAAGARAASAT